MPMLHTVLFHFDPVKLTEEFKDNEIMECLAAIKLKIPGVVEVNFGEKDITPWDGYVDCSKGYTHMLVSKYTDEAALKAYAEDPTHLQLNARFRKCSIEPPLRVELKI